jgi:RND family efflux transporter MFP subunit
VITVRTATLPDTFEAGGVVRARTTAAVTSRLLAPVLRVHVSPGDRVRAGDVLVRLDDRDLAAAQRRASSGREAAEQAGRAAVSNRDAAHAALALATATHTRIAALHARKSSTDSELDEAVANLRAAEARVASAEAGVAEAAAGLSAAAAGAEGAAVGASWAVIRAPFDGLVTEKLVEAGNMATPGMPLLRLEETAVSRLEVRLDESRAHFASPGQPVTVVFDVPVGATGAVSGASGADDTGAATGGTLVHDGRVTEVARAVEAGAHAYLVKIELPRGLQVPSGVFARARFAGTARPALAVPQSAVVRRGQLTSVFVVDDGRARMRLVSLGRTIDGGQAGMVEVLAGVDDGEQVIDRPSAALADGVRVRRPGAQS